MRLVGFTSLGIMALIADAGGGNAVNPTANRNRPAINPVNWLDRVAWHSDFFQYEVAADEEVSVNHTSLAGKTLYYGCSGDSGLVNGSTSPPVGGGITVVGVGDVRETNITLYTHSLGYKPVCFVEYDGRVIGSGTLVQTEASGTRLRWVVPYATTSIIGLREIAVSSASALTAASRDYRLLICRNPEPDPELPLFGRDGGHIQLGRGIVDSRKKYVRRLGSGESGFDIDLGRTMDARGGGFRIASGGVTIDDPYYTGSFTGPDYITVGV